MLPVLAALPASKPDAGPHQTQGATIIEALTWEKRMRRRVFVAVLLATFVPALLLSALTLVLDGQPMTPAHLNLKAAVAAAVAVPMFAVFTATPWWRALRLWCLTLAALAVIGVLLSMLQRPFYGRLPSLDQLVNFVLFFQFAALTLWLPMMLGLATGARRVRGVAPIVFAGLLVFGLAPLLGMRLTQWLTGSQTGAAWVLSGPGLDTGFILLALPVGLLAWRRLKALAPTTRPSAFPTPSCWRAPGGCWWWPATRSKGSARTRARRRSCRSWRSARWLT